MDDRSFILHDETFAARLHMHLKNNWRAMAAAGKPLEVIVREAKSKRSNEANKRYWALLSEIADGAYVDGKRFSKEAWHEHFARLYIGVEELPSGDTKAISTTTLDVAAFGDYMTAIEAYAASELAVEFV
jgi:hypothetical protein